MSPLSPVLFGFFFFFTGTAPRLHLSHFSFIFMVRWHAEDLVQTTNDGSVTAEEKKIREETTRTVETIKCQNICDSLPRASRVWREPSLFLLLLTLS